MRDADKLSQIRRWDDLSSQPIDTSVIDPLDTRGQKNRYISELRNDAIVGTLDAHAIGEPVLDFGCGTGGLSAALAASGRRVVGVDISPGLLGRTRERSYASDTLFVRYAGDRLPMIDASVAAATTYVVLTHIIEDDDLLGLLGEIFRVLKPGGLLVAGEQVRTRRTTDTTTWQTRRTIAEFCALCRRVGFEIVATPVVRYGRFPTTYLLRYGLLPTSMHAPLRRLERRVGSWLGPLGWDYSDVCFVVRRPASAS